MTVFAIIAVIMGSIIVMGITASIRALQCPNCYKNYKWHDKRRYNMLKWQDVQQKDICKYCAWTVDVKDFTPPKTSWLKMMAAYSPLKQFNIVKDIKDRRKK